MSAHQFGLLYSCTITLPSVSSKAVSVSKVGGCVKVCHFCALAKPAKARQATSAIPDIFSVFIFVLFATSLERDAQKLWGLSGAVRLALR